MDYLTKKNSAVDSETAVLIIRKNYGGQSGWIRVEIYRCLPCHSAANGVYIQASIDKVCGIVGIRLSLRYAKYDMAKQGYMLLKSSVSKVLYYIGRWGLGGFGARKLGQCLCAKFCVLLTHHIL